MKIFSIIQILVLTASGFYLSLAQAATAREKQILAVERIQDSNHPDTNFLRNSLIYVGLVEHGLANKLNKIFSTSNSFTPGSLQKPNGIQCGNYEEFGVPYGRISSCAWNGRSIDVNRVDRDGVLIFSFLLEKIRVFEFSTSPYEAILTGGPLTEDLYRILQSDKTGAVSRYGEILIVGNQADGNFLICGRTTKKEPTCKIRLKTENEYSK